MIPAGAILYSPHVADQGYHKSRIANFDILNNFLNIMAQCTQFFQLNSLLLLFVKLCVYIVYT